MPSLRRETTNAAARLPLPSLSCSRFPFEADDESAFGCSAHDAVGVQDGLSLLTDLALFEACGVRIAFTGRAGGVSSGPYSGLNLGTHVNDDLQCVHENRRRLLSALSCPQVPIIVPNQVHGTRVLALDRACDAEELQEDAAQGADGLAIFCEDVAALLCFADCMPVIIVAPTGDFAVVHSGWRGAYGHIAVKALGMLCEHSHCAPCECNAYLGPYIHAACFEVGEDLEEKFRAEFGEDCVSAPRHVDLGRAVTGDLIAAGMDWKRIASAGICTVCNSDDYFSYRASGGLCGRHGACAVRLSR